MKLIIIIPTRIIGFAITLALITALDILFIRILSFNFKQPFLITKKDFIEMKNWTLNK